MGIATSFGIARAAAFARAGPRSPLGLAAPMCRVNDAGRGHTTRTGVLIPMVPTSLWAQLLVVGTVHSQRPFFQSGFVTKAGELCYGPVVLRHFTTETLNGLV